jgi:hypothetical protein
LFLDLFFYCHVSAFISIDYSWNAVLLGKAKGMACSVGVVVDEREQDIRLRQHHLLVASETGAAAITVPVGRVALYRPAVAFPDVLS